MRKVELKALKARIWEDFLHDVLKYMVAIGGFSLLIMFIFGNRDQTRVNQYYVIASNCFVAITPERRTPEYMRGCYDKAQRITGIKAERFGDGK